MTKKIGMTVLCWLLLTPAAWAVEALSTAELVSHCDKYDEPGAADHCDIGSVNETHSTRRASSSTSCFPRSTARRSSTPGW